MCLLSVLVIFCLFENTDLEETNLQVKAMPKNAQTTSKLHSSHTLVK